MITLHSARSDLLMNFPSVNRDPFDANYNKYIADIDT